MPGRNLSQAIRSAENAQQFANGGALVGVQFAPTIIEYLRPMPVLERAGAIRMSGISGGPGTIRFPKQVGDIYGQWAAAAKVGSTRANTLPCSAWSTCSPKRLVAQVRIDKQLLLQESFDVEAYCRNSINLQFALSYDLAGLIGNGNGMPLGILNTGNINAGAVTFNGPSASSGTLAPQYAEFPFLPGPTVLAANAQAVPSGKRTFITSPQSMINWAGVPKATPAATQTVNDKWMLEFGVGGKELSVRGEEALETTYLNTLPTAYTAAAASRSGGSGPGRLRPVQSQYMFLEWASAWSGFLRPVHSGLEGPHRPHLPHVRGWHLPAAHRLRHLLERRQRGVRLIGPAASPAATLTRARPSSMTRFRNSLVSLTPSSYWPAPRLRAGGRRRTWPITPISCS